MKSEIKNKLTAYSVAAGAAALGIASVANAQVQAGVVGDGLYYQFGPQDDNGQYLGVRASSYDAWGGDPYWTTFPGPEDPAVDHKAPSGFTGYASIAVNPYTGAVVTDIPMEHMVGGPSLSGPSGLPDDPATPDVDESIITSPYVDTMSTGSEFAQDCLYFTTELVDHSGKQSDSFFANASSDGGVLWGKMGVGDEVRAYDGAWHLEMTIPDDPETPGNEETWARVLDDPDDHFNDPNYDTSMNFTQREELYYYDDWFAVGGTWRWGGTGYLGFEMDGIQGWALINIGGDRSGMLLRELYFDVAAGLRGDFDGDGDIDADDIDILMANLGGDPGEFDLTDDGVVDQDDIDEWVFNIVPIGENVGTVYGDFNLDGEVNAGDLALLATNYGLVGTWGWATGDGNGDGNVDAGDLAMLATNYGTVVHPVPEPVTLSLLAVGGAALLRRRK